MPKKSFERILAEILSGIIMATVSVLIVAAFIWAARLLIGVIK